MTTHGTEAAINLTPVELAERLRTSIPTLARWRSKGTGPTFLKSGGKVLYPLDKVEAYEAGNTHQRTREQA